ncbi:MAG: hypothetical protein UY50_C0021G0003 [Parcubacteria group bacterium GW2011_GWA2_49_9]|nr:MAG: hypothetical protein UY50_C0021G0003 [Parcubacteria group bacterium GW2011_GWA2_49_9]
MKTLSTIKVPRQTKAILWDMDGVLVDSLSLDLWVVNELLAKCAGKEVTLPRGFIRSIFAFDIPKFWELIFERVKKEFNIPISAIEQKSIVKTYTALRQKSRFPVGAGVESIIEAAKRQGIKNAAVSNNPRQEVEEILERAGILEKFDIVVGNDALSDMKRKPAPDIYLYTLLKLGISSNEAVVIEDSVTGVEAGKRAGCYVIGVASGGTSLEVLQDYSQYCNKAYENF